MNNLPSLAKGWWSFDLPGHREHPKSATYSLFAYESLPPIQDPLDDQFAWLQAESPKKDTLADGEYATGEKPDLSGLARFMRQPNVTLPASFVTFMQSPS